MKAKKHLCLAAAASISICAVVYSLPFFTDNTIVDALTRPSEETASMLLDGVKIVSVRLEIRSNVLSCYEQLSSKNLSAEITKQLDKYTDAVVKEEYGSDGDILVDIQLKGKKETEFVAADISVSFSERVQPERISYYFTGITWQSRKTLLVHKNEIMEEVPKNIQYLVSHLCRYLPHTKMTQKAMQE